MKRRTTGLLAVLLLTGLHGVAQADAVEQWKFQVSLDNSVIGTHEFRLEEEQGAQRLTSEAAFDVRFLFFTAFRYRHENTERWSGGCLQGIQARTVSNGKTQQVSGTREQESFIVKTDQQQQVLPECVMSFAYWNPRFLQQTRLLNPQTGEYLDVEIEELATDTLEVRGVARQASHYRLTAKGVDVELWYSLDNEWLALQSIAGGDRVIRYELI